jgi:outer membrane protein OmpA-like peptidoglycan-associated protein/tetratricopeptide (TPR) repeat protein
MRILLALICTFFTIIGYGQTGGSSDKKAIKSYAVGREYFKKQQWESAEKSLLEAIDRDDEYLDAMNLLTEVYIGMERLDESKKWTRKIIEINPNYSPNLILILATLEQYESNYSEALIWYEKYLKMAPPESSNYRAAKKGAACCEFAQWALKHPVDFQIENLGPNINSEHSEYFPAMTADEALLMYTRATPVERAQYYENDRNEDFFFSEKVDDGTWGPSFNPGPPLNTPLNEGAPTLSPDGKYLIFTACDLGDMGNYGPDKKGFGHCDLFVCIRQGNKWSRPVNMGQTINSKHWESQPSFASDGKTIYFIRGKYDRYGERQDDIYMTEMVNGKWAPAQPLPNNINTEGKEESVFIHPDNKTLYFSSDGHVGMGGMDIFMTKKQDDGTWSNPINLGYPINTSEQENSFHVSASGGYAIIASSREGGLGKLDLYKLTLPVNLRPQQITYLKGKIKDAKTKKPLEATFQLIDLVSGDTVVTTTSDAENGSFLVVLPASEQYGLIADHDGYLFHSENFALDFTKDVSHFEKNIDLQPMEAGSSIVLKNIFFDTDKFELKPTSKTELDKLQKLLTNNPKLRIEISGHTDNQGNAAANVILSRNRAKSVYDFLIRTGIEANRLSYEGYGQAKPIASNETEEGRQLNRRTEFIILE